MYAFDVQVSVFLLAFVVREKLEALAALAQLAPRHEGMSGVLSVPAAPSDKRRRLRGKQATDEKGEAARRYALLATAEEMAHPAVKFAGAGVRRKHVHWTHGRSSDPAHVQPAELTREQFWKHLEKVYRVVYGPSKRYESFRRDKCERLALERSQPISDTHCELISWEVCARELQARPAASSLSAWSQKRRTVRRCPACAGRTSTRQRSAQRLTTGTLSRSILWPTTV